MNRTVITAAAGAVAAFALVAAAVAGYLVGNSHAAGNTVTRTVTVTKTAPPKIITRWNTKTVTVAATATPQAAGIPCLEEAGRIWVSGGALGTSATQTTCHVVAVAPDSLGEFELVAADGTSGGIYGPVSGG
jgi:hypothetical protein